MLLPAGAIGGIDAIAAMRLGRLESLCATARASRRWPGADRRLKMWSILATLAKPAVLYRGNARRSRAALSAERQRRGGGSACRVSASSAREVELVADPACARQRARDRGRGRGRTLCHQLQGKPSRTNPKTSALGGARASRAHCCNEQASDRHLSMDCASAQGTHWSEARSSVIEDFRFLTRARTNTSMISRSRTCCMPSSCAARSRTAASAPSTKSAALARPGVHAVITATDIGPEAAFQPFRCGRTGLRRSSHSSSPSLPMTRCAMSASRSAVILAETQAAAEDALDAVASRLIPCRQ